MDKPTGKTHKLSRLSDLLKLSPPEFKRLLPDLVTWYKVTRMTAEFAGCPPESMGASLEWTDDGLKQVNGVRLDFGALGVVDLLKPETWPKDLDKAETDESAKSRQSE